MMLRRFFSDHPLISAILLVCGMVIVYYATTYAAHLYFSNRYPNHGIHTAENMK